MPTTSEDLALGHRSSHRQAGRSRKPAIGMMDELCLDASMVNARRVAKAVAEFIEQVRRI